MGLKKTVIDEVFKCYSVNALNIDGETQLVFAGEGPGVLNIYSGETFETKKKIWDADDTCGGTMSVVTVPEYEGYFFVSKGFFSMVDSDTSAIYLMRYKDGVMTEEKIVEIPFLHRFDIVQADGKRFLVAASLHGGKQDKEDWSKPGKVYVAELPADLTKSMHIGLTVLVAGLTKNHGFNRGQWQGQEVVFVASKSGVLAVIPPQLGKEAWSTEVIFDFPVSDVAAIDLDGDGELEFAIMSPFHGNQIDIYKKIEGKYQSVFKYEKEQDFYHAINADTFNGVPTFVLGARKDPMDLFMVQYDETLKTFKSILIESQVGAANARIIHTEKGDIIMSANRQINQAAIYR